MPPVLRIVRCAKCGMHHSNKFRCPVCERTEQAERAARAIRLRASEARSWGGFLFLVVVVLFFMALMDGFPVNRVLSIWALVCLINYAQSVAVRVEDENDD